MHDIYTIGYRGMTLERLIEIMDEKNINRLLDVRSKPYSRQVQFNGRELAKHLGERYLWKGDILGGLSGPIPEEGIAFLVTIRQTETVLIMCMEHDPVSCHRLYDIGRRLYAACADAIHLIDENGVLREAMTSMYEGGKLWK